MDLHYLRLFNSLASEQSFSRAADILHISQPALSVQIKKLEGDLNIKLFDKVGNRIVLNDNGKLLHEYTKRIFLIVEEAEQQLLKKKDFVGGSISIGGSNTSGSYLLPKIIGEFKKQYPYVNINLHIANTDEIAHLIFNSKLDFAINGGSLIYGGNIHVELLMEDRVVLAVSPDCPLTEKKYVHPSDLYEIDFVSHEQNSQLYKLAEKIINEVNIPSKISMTFGSIDAIKQAVAANLGISPIPLSAIFVELQLGLIKELRLAGKNWSYPYSLIYNKDKYLSPAAKKLMELVRLRIISKALEME